MGYLGHVISNEGVKVDQSKIEAITKWPLPRTVRAVRGFLGLSGYYRKFIQGYGVIAAPLTKLLRKIGFSWNEEAEEAFLALKKSLSESPVLALPDFTRDFIVECDASGSGIGAVLQQDGHPIAFYSRKLAERHMKLAAYERELIGLAKAIIHWRPYLWGRHFVIRTDHYSLKFLLEQRLSTSPHIHWISKLLGFDFGVEFRSGMTNKVADASSRRNETTIDESCEVYALHSPDKSILTRLRQEIDQSTKLGELRDRIIRGEESTIWEARNGLIFRKGQAYIDADSVLVQEVVSSFHNFGHEGVQKTMDRIRRDFYWKGWKKSVQEFISNCQVCQQNKWETLQPAGLMQPLSVPTRIWADISMDFVEALPKVSGKTVILVVVDRFSKYAHFIALSHPYTAVSVAEAFFRDIVRLHGIPETIVSDRDKVFRSIFWRELFKLLGTNLCFTTAYRPQSDGQTEVVNRTLEMYLRCVTGDVPKKWLTWLPWVEYCYNTSFHTSLKTTPFKMVYGREPPRLLDYNAGSSQVEAVDVALEKRDEFLAMARERLLDAQNRMKTVYDNHHRALEFKVGDWVWLKIQPYRQLTVARKSFNKLSPKFYGPFEVLARIGSVSYRLRLPETTQIHDVFHVSLLKEHKGEHRKENPNLPPILQGRVMPPKPVKLLRARMRGGARQILVKWTEDESTSSTWEDAEKLLEAYPEMEFEDKLLVEEGSNDTRYGITYHRKKK